jgi:protein ImuA
MASMRTRTDPHALIDLRRRLAEASLRAVPAGRDVESGTVSFGTPVLDGALGGGIARAALHEIHAPGTADLVAATGFAVGLAIRAAGPRPILWVRQDVVDVETGRLHPPGLTELGLDPARVLLVRARDAEGVLRAGGEAARCSALGAVLIEPWGEPRRLDLTASRRLSLAAEGSGATTLLLRAAVTAQPSAARTRWLVSGLPSRALEANAPGDPAFSLRLLRHRGGLDEREWHVEWSRDRQSFADSVFRSRPAFAGFHPAADRPGLDAAPLPGAVVPFPADGPAAAGGENPGIRRAG